MGVRRMYARQTCKGLHKRYGAMIASLSKWKSKQWHIVLSPGYSVCVQSDAYIKGYACHHSAFKFDLYDIDSWLSRASMCTCEECRERVVSHTLANPDKPLPYMAEWLVKAKEHGNH